MYPIKPEIFEVISFWNFWSYALLRNTDWECQLHERFTCSVGHLQVHQHAESNGIYFQTSGFIW
jgi:hypothetical protein